MDKITQILENVVAGVHSKNPIKNSCQDGLGRTTQTLDHVVVVHILIWDKRKSQINEYSDTSTIPPIRQSIKQSTSIQWNHPELWIIVQRTVLHDVDEINRKLAKWQFQQTQINEHKKWQWLYLHTPADRRPL